MNKIIQGDCLVELKKLPDNSVDCIVTSPPYNKGFYDKHKPHPKDVWKQRNIKYGSFADNLEPQLYIEQQKSVLKELVRIVKLSGSIFYNHKTVIANHKAIFPTYVYDFNVRQLIIWDRGSTPQIAPIRFLPTTEYVFWITKTNCQPKFKRENLYFNNEVWRITPTPMKDHPAPFPEKLVRNCLLATTDKNDIVLDCYMGSGTTGKVAKELKRNYIGIELNPDYIKIAKARIENVNNTLFNM
jgi:site-specific DNA-methyltransferase (adenine-specific)